MKIDAEQLNYIHNRLKALVGEQGAFVLIAVKPDGEGGDLQIRIFGPDSRLTGALDIGWRNLRKHLEKKIDEAIQSLPREPD